MLSTKQIKFLKKEAHHLKPIFQIGKGGINDDMLIQIKQALEKRELIKISLLQNTLEEPEDVAAVLTNQCAITVVQMIGHTLVLYKQSNTVKHRHISERVNNI